MRSVAVSLAQFHQTFIEESIEGMDAMEAGLLSLETGAPDKEVINTIFRAAHSIKGGGATFGFVEIAKFTHAMETLLDEMRNGRLEVTQEGINVFLQSVDCLRGMIAAARDGGEVDGEQVAILQQQLERLLSENVVHRDSQAEVPQTHDSRPATRDSPSGWRIAFRPKAHLFRTGNDPVRIFRELDRLGELHVEVDSTALPALADLNPEDCYLGWTARLTGDAPREALEEAFAWVIGDCELEITPLKAERKGIGSSAVLPQTAQPASELIFERRKGERRKGDRRVAGAAGLDATSIRVGIDKIDEIINQVGELVITQSMLSTLGEDFDMNRVHRLRDGLSQLERNTRELQEGVMRMRMLPIGFAFNRFPRMVHDLSTKLGKKAQLSISGEETELDKTVIEKIGDPLVHLVRNSLDHGIEPPEERVARGKPEVGTVSLNAYHKGGNIVIEIADDGKGINREKILEKAIAQGLADPDAEYSPEQIDDLMFIPGLSTVGAVSDVSGRGVGMDVVRRNIQSLGGMVEVASKPGQGATFTVRLPLTLAIVEGQSIAVGDEYYIVPLVSIIESLQVGADRVNLVAGRGEVLRFRDEYIPIVRLYQVFGAEPRTKVITEGLLVIVEGDGHRAALLVDELLGQQQVVIKSLEANYKRIEGISGATILGDGSVALILDVSGLIRVAHQ